MGGAEGVDSSQLLLEPCKADEQREGATELQTCANLFNELEGLGLLGLPYAIRLVGVVGGTLCMACAGLLATATGVFIAKSMYDKDGSRICSSYGDLGEVYFGKRGRLLVELVQQTNLLMVGIVFLVLIGSTLDTAFPNAIGADELFNGARLWKAIATVIVLPTVHLGGLSRIALLSYVSIVSLGTAVVLVLVSCGEQLHEQGNRTIESVDTHPHWNRLPAVFSICVFAFSAHGVFPELEAAMLRPQNFTKLLGFTYGSNFVLKIGFSLVAFFAFGAETDQVVSGNISSNSQRVAISLCIAANTCLTFPLPMEVFFRSVETSASWGNSRCKRALFRSLTVVGCGVVAIALPDFAIAMGFAGSCSQMLLTFVFPAVFYALSRRNGHGLRVAEAVLCIVAVAVGVFGSVSGIVSTVLLITDHHNTTHSR
jgi:vesicular inhibitory amino acid transporter